MPAKIRCQGCDKVLKVPDEARGKVIKCTSCGTRLRIPAGKGQPGPAKKKAAAKAAGDEGDFLANLDLEKVEDTSVRVCPKCGTPVDEDDVDCPKCGVDLETGVMSARTRRKRARKGAEPKEYYQDAFKNGWRFIVDNKSLAFRTFVITLLFTSAFFGCSYLVAYCDSMELKVLWGFCAFITAMVSPGWAWHLWTEVLLATLKKKKKLKRVNFDMFLCSALGMKVVFWTTIFTLPIQLFTGSIGGFLWMRGQPIAGGIFIGLGFFLALMLVPIAMTHMAMPVTYRGWLSPSLLGVYFKTAGPALFWATLFVLTMLLPTAAWGAIGVVSGDKLASGSVAATDLIVPAVLWAAGCFLYGFCILFNMRTNGLFAQYFNPNLELIAVEAEKKYVPKIKRTDEFGEPQADTTGKKVGIGLAVSLVLALAGGAIFGLTGGRGLLTGIGTGFLAVGYITAFVGGLMILVAAFQEDALWGVGCLLVPFVSLVFVILHWNEAKWGFLVNLAGGFMIGVGVVTAGFGIFSQMSEEIEKQQGRLEQQPPAAMICRVDTVPGRFTITL